MGFNNIFFVVVLVDISSQYCHNNLLVDPLCEINQVLYLNFVHLIKSLPLPKSFPILLAIKEILCTRGWNLVTSGFVNARLVKPILRK